MPERSKTQAGPPISVDAAIDEIGAAGSVAGLAQAAALDLVAEIAGAKAVRLRREVLRISARDGAGAETTRLAARRIDRHAAYAAALESEQARAAVPVPAADPAAAIVYGRVLRSDGSPAPGLAVEAQAPAGTAPAAPCPTDAKGAYVLRVPASGETTAALRVVDPKTKEVLATTDPFRVSAGARTYREVRLPRAKDGETKCSCGHETGGTHPPPAEVLMPNLVGMSEARARAVLEKLGATRVATKSVDAASPAGEVVGQSPAAGRRLGADAQVELAVSAGREIAVPDLVKLTVAEATVVLNQAGLVLGKVAGDAKEDRIAAQDPAAGRKVRAGSAVDVTLRPSRQPPTRPTTGKG